jgi:hypothetical protein
MGTNGSSIRAGGSEGRERTGGAAANRALLRARGLAALAVVALLQSGCAAPSAATYVRARATSPGAVVDVGFFYSELSPYGRWFYYPAYGRCWTPYGVPAGWRPYSDGYWAYTEFGWT